ncbi:F-box protein At5g46170 [Phoenix dactylifera]|uniref:F-box protein At5g46170 n=1 Tax=Phoenix dactylifera TaxID=42345 RepID=A0A8B7C9C7_PHODC|nr:F-box protein At5g46170 [Phoenix dactylifera]
MAASGSRGEADLEGSPPWRGDQAAGKAAAVEGEEEEEGIDHFDRLPDSVLLVVFNRIGDVKGLGRCCVVCRRFQALVPLVDDVVVRVDCVISDDATPSSVAAAASSGCGLDKGRGVLSHLARLVLDGLVKPLQALGQMLIPASAAARRSSASSSSSEVSHHSPTEVLKNFKEIRRLRIELPAGELGVDDGVLLKWKADFGSTLDSCVILGASSIVSPNSSNPNPSIQDACSGDDSGSIPEFNGTLKLRVLWTISSLIAASARHYLLQPIIADHETLESLDLTDADGQGVLAMNKGQLQDLRVKPVSASGTSQRTLLPALTMRLCYAPHLELPGGVLLKGATLVAIRPSEDQSREAPGGSIGSSDGCWVSHAFEEPYRTASKMLLKRTTYCLEMNSF